MVAEPAAGVQRLGVWVGVPVCLGKWGQLCVEGLGFNSSLVAVFISSVFICLRLFRLNLLSVGRSGCSLSVGETGFEFY